MKGSVFDLLEECATRAHGEDMWDLLLEPGLASTPIGAATRVDAPLVTSARVLLAEDGLDNQRMLRLFLEKAGATVTVVDNGRSAVEEARTGGYDVVLMDMQMPILDGYDAAAELRSIGSQVPIVALTAHAMAGDRDRCLRAGCDDYLTKPVERRGLVETVERWTSTHRTIASEEGEVDPAVASLVSEFAAAAFMRAEEVARAAERGDIARVKLVAHQLRGAAGMYGFHALSACAGGVEDALSKSDDLACVEGLVRLLQTLKRDAA